MTIREKRLYRIGFKTFEDYCVERWSFGRRYVNQIIQASEVISNLGPMGPVIPQTESQVRPLTSLEQLVI